MSQPNTGSLPDQPGPEQPGPEQPGPEQPGLGQPRPDRTGDAQPSAAQPNEPNPEQQVGPVVQPSPSEPTVRQTRKPLSSLLRHREFRRYLALRATTQTADGTLQVAMASYVLLSPERAPNALAIATVLAITYLPFSIIGPFVSPLLDRWPRQRVVLVTDIIRAGIALTLAGIVVSGAGSHNAGAVAMMGLLLVALSLNRFLLAGLSAGLHHTVRPNEYLSASSIMPMIGPAGVLIGGVVAFGVRLGLTPRVLSANQADALIFAIAAIGFVASAFIASGYGTWALGPSRHGRVAHDQPMRPAQIWSGLAHAFTHLWARRPAAIGLGLICLVRVNFGMMSAAMILAFRNHFHSVDQVNAAVADIGIWVGLTGAGFVLSAVLVPIVARRLGVRRTILVLLVVGGLGQAVLSSIWRPWPLMLCGFVIGLAAQSVKVCVDTIVHAHTDPDAKGRVFVIYDMLFNTMFVIGGFGAVLLPADGLSRPAFIELGLALALAGVAFIIGTRRAGDADYNVGTGLVDQSGGPAPTS